MGEAMKKVDHLVVRAFKGAMAFVLAVGLCPLAPAMAQEGATANEEGGTAAAVADGAGASTDGAVAGAAGDVAGSKADGVQPVGVFGDGDAAADGVDVGASAQDAIENDGTGSGVSTDAAEAASAADGEADESNDAAAQTDGWQAWGGCEWMIDAEGCLTIRPANGAEVGQLPNVAGYAPWCVDTYAHSIESVKVEKCVKTSDSANDLFKDLSAAVTMDLSGLDVSSATNMSYMFRDCESLASLDLSGWDVSSVTNMSDMFSSCSSLASLDLSGWDTSSVTNMSDMFLFCSSLASLDLSGWDASKVTDMSSMFSGCSSLASLDLSGWDTSSVTDMSGMFFECTSLSSLDLSGWDTSKATDMSWMFSYCSSLASLDLSGWDVSSVTNMSEMFRVCESLASLDLSGWDVSSVTNMDDMFCDCSSLASLDLSGWDVSFATPTFDMFSGCSSMREVSLGPATLVDLPAPSGDGVSGRWVSSVDGVAYRPSDVPTGVAATYTAQLAKSEALDLNSLGSCVWTLEEGGTLAISPLPGCASGNLCDMHRGDYPFSRHSSEITSVRVAPGVKASESLSGLFSGLSAAVTMDLSGLDVSSATNMSYMFRDCESLASLDLSGWDTSSVTNMSSMFSGCSSLASLDLSSFDDSSLKSDTYRSDMFNGCVILERILVGEHFALRDLMPVPSSIEGWTGKWVNEAGSAFTSGEVPVGKKDIYRAQIGLNADMFTVDCSDSAYTGYEITKAVLSSKLLEGLDYNVSYSSNVYVGIASIDITGIGRATGALHYEFNITKAAPDYEAPVPVDAVYGQRLGDLSLPQGFSWQDGALTPVGEPGEHEFLAMFTPGDTSNYEVVRDGRRVGRGLLPRLLRAQVRHRKGDARLRGPRPCRGRLRPNAFRRRAPEGLLVAGRRYSC